MSNRNPSGAVHPTIFLVGWFAVSFGLQRLWPFGLPGAALLEPLEIGLSGAGVVLFGWAVFELRKHGTTMEHKDTTTALVTGGPYRLSRHPIYAALILILLGLAIEANSLWFVLLTVVFWGAVQWLTVVREEEYLEREFGAEYLRYKSSVRQWL